MTTMRFATAVAVISAVVLGSSVSAQDCNAWKDYAESECNAVSGCVATVTTSTRSCLSDQCRTEGRRARRCEAVSSSTTTAAPATTTTAAPAATTAAAPAATTTTATPAATTTAPTTPPATSGASVATCNAKKDYAESECNAVAGCVATVSTSTSDCLSDQCRAEGKRARRCEPVASGPALSDASNTTATASSSGAVGPTVGIAAAVLAAAGLLL